MDMTVHTTHIPSPVGDLVAAGSDDGLVGLWFPDHRGSVPADPAWRRDDGAFAALTEQLGEYFAGERTDFDVRLAPAGTAFQRQVWDALREIPYGETRSYGEIAARLGLAAAASRAVGLANGRNPISIIVPCHRVIGATGALTGYAGGVECKRYLLDLEAGRLPLALA
jgi:methylated-DNA-[protein]-cysteine S-methyltransferase